MGRAKRWALAVAGVASAIACACSSSESASTSEADVGTKPAREWRPGPPKEGNLRIATFNIRNFPKDVMGAPDGGADASAEGGAAEPDRDTRPRIVRKQENTDEAMLVDVLDRLDFDLLAVQEINDTERFASVLARLGAKNGRSYDAQFSLAWQHPQHVGVVVRRDRLRLDGVKVHGEIATRPTMRAGLSAHVTSTRPGGVDFGVLVVHLASGDSAGRASLRAEQAKLAAEVVAARQKELGDRDFVVLGDMNTALQDKELPGLDGALGGGGTSLARETPDLGCTSYYVKSPNDPLVQPAWIDQVYLASMQERDRTVALTVGAHCWERACKPFESDSKENGTSYWAVSDHCPVYFEVTDRGAD